MDRNLLLTVGLTLMTLWGSSWGQNTVVLKGKVTLVGTEPPELKENSYINIKFKRISRQDSPYNMIASYVSRVDLTSVHETRSFMYEFTTTRPRRCGKRPFCYAISAVINNGWSSSGTQEWIRPGDYLSTSVYHVSVNEEDSMYNIDMDVEQFRR